MPVSKLSDSGTSAGSKKKYQSFLAGNSPQTPDAWDSISTTTLSGSQTTITFSIPQTYGHLRFHVLAKTTDTVSSSVDNLAMNFNSDTGANYTRQYSIVENKAASPSISSTATTIRTYKKACVDPAMRRSSSGMVLGKGGAGCVSLHNTRAKTTTIRTAPSPLWKT